MVSCPDILATPASVYAVCSLSRSRSFCGPEKKWAADDDWIGELHRDKLEREEVDGQHVMEEELRDLVSTNGWNHLYAVSEG